MPHRRRPSTAALLTALLLLAVSTPALAQDGEEATSSENPAGQGEGSDTAGEGSTSGADNCDPNYQGACLDPDSEDYDCEGGGGDGPRYVPGPLEVVGDDPSGLDTDDPDNIACEESLSSGDSGGGGDSDNDTPSGSVDSGYGPVAPAREADAPLPLAIVCGGLGLLGLVGLGLARTRRAG